MKALDLCYGRRVLWRGLVAEIVNIRWAPRTVLVQIRVMGNHTHWTTPDALEVADEPSAISLQLLARNARLKAES